MKWNDILNSLKQFGQNHNQIEDVQTGWGKEEIKESSKYTLMFIQPVPGSMIRYEKSYNFIVYFIDKELHDKSNRESIIDSGIQLAEDLFNYYDEAHLHTNLFYIDSNANYNLIDSELNDSVGGVWIEIKCIINYNITCDAPINYYQPSPSTPTSFNTHYTLDWTYIVNTPTTLSGYTILDAYTILECNNNFLSANTALNDLSDVTTTGVVSGMVLKYSGNTWVAGFDLSGSTVDLSNYYTKQEVYNTGETYTITEVDNIISAITVDLSGYYTSSQTNDNFLSANTFIPSDFYSTSESDANFLSASTLYVTPTNFNNHTGDTTIHFTLDSFQNNFLSANTNLDFSSNFLSANTSFYTQLECDNNFLSANTSLFQESEFLTYTGVTAPNLYVDVAGDTMTGDLSIQTLSSTTEKIITVSGLTGTLQNYLTTDSEWITNSTIISNIISGSNWLDNSYIGTTTGAVEGQKYQDDYFLYVYSNSVFKRYKNENSTVTLFSPNSATTSQTATTLIDIVICSGATGFTLYLPTSLIYGQATIKNVNDVEVLLVPISGFIDGSSGQTLYQYDYCNLFTFGGNYYIK